MKTVKNIYKRILCVMKDLNYIKKEDKRINKMYNFVSHDAVSKAVHPLLTKHGICVVPTILEHQIIGNRTEIKIKVEFINADRPDERLETISYGYGIDNQDKGIGKAYSYAFKYALLKIFVLETGNDPERDSIKFEKPINALFKYSKTSPEEIKKFNLATKQQIDKFNNIVEVYKIHDLDPDLIKGWLKAANVSSITEMPAHKLQKCIDWFTVERINKLKNKKNEEDNNNIEEEDNNIEIAHKKHIEYVWEI